MLYIIPIDGTYRNYGSIRFKLKENLLFSCNKKDKKENYVT